MRSVSRTSTKGRRFAGLLTGFAFAFLIVACAQNPRVLNVPVTAVISGKDSVSNQDVEDAILRAGSRLGWSMTKAAPGMLIASKSESDQMAMLGIDFQMSMYSLRYRDSRNFKFKSKPVADMKGTIHDPDYATIDKKYNLWVKDLDQAIQRELSELR